MTAREEELLRRFLRRLEEAAPEPPLEELRARIARLEEEARDARERWLERAWERLCELQPKPISWAYADTGSAPAESPFAEVPADLDGTNVVVLVVDEPTFSYQGFLELDVRLREREREDDLGVEPREYELFVLVDGKKIQSLTVRSEVETHLSLELPPDHPTLDPEHPEDWPLRFALRAVPHPDA